MKKSKKWWLSLLLVLVCIRLLAYGEVGHRAVAWIAYKHLTPKAKAQMNRLLGEGGLPRVATWADVALYSKPSLYPHTMYWHFVNIEENHYVASQLDTVYDSLLKSGNNIVFVIDSLVHRLKTQKNDTIALKFLVHFVGDIHQPMHVGKKSDRGGNDVWVQWGEKKVNLHAVWDTYLIGRAMDAKTYANHLMKLYRKREILLSADARTTDILPSFKKSYFLSREIYAYDHSLLDVNTYSTHFSPIISETVLRAGMKLASILNDIYK